MFFLKILTFLYFNLVLFQNKQFDKINIKFHCHTIILCITITHDKYGYLKIKHVNKKSEIHKSYYWPKLSRHYYLFDYLCTSFKISLI